jgi:carbonic anhydrase
MHRKMIYFIFICSLFLNCNMLSKENEHIAINTAPKAIEALKEGNARFISEKMINNKQYKKQIENTKHGQHPFAIVLGCIDSRVPPEIIFDQAIGNLFVTRIAGNVDDSFVIASIEYAIAIKHTKLVVVLGHNHCGAVNGAMKDIELGHLSALADQIQPAILNHKSYPFEEENADLTSKKNVEMTIQHLKSRSKIVNALVQKNEVLLVGAFYNIETGEVEFI